MGKIIPRSLKQGAVPATSEAMTCVRLIGMRSSLNPTKGREANQSQNGGKPQRAAISRFVQITRMSLVKVVWKEGNLPVALCRLVYITSQSINPVW
jgi:hypothetical protein